MTNILEAIRGEIAECEKKLDALRTAYSALGGEAVKPPGKTAAPRQTGTGAGKESSSLDTILKLLFGKPPMKTPALTEAAGLSGPTVYKVLNENPTLFVKGGGLRSSEWSLSEAGAAKANSLN